MINKLWISFALIHKKGWQMTKYQYFKLYIKKIAVTIKQAH